MRAVRDTFEGLGEEADHDPTCEAQVRERHDAEEDLLLTASTAAFLTVRDIARETGLLASMTAEHWTTLCDRFTPAPHLHEAALRSNATRATWPPLVS